MVRRFSVLTAVCDPPAGVLDRCLASVRNQDLLDWEHIIVDDASVDVEVCEALRRAAADPRVRIVHRRTRGGIVAASSDALAAAGGELVALLDHDDELAPHALSAMAAAFDDEECDVAYSDHDLIRPDGRRAEPFFKPDFSPERLRHQNYITHLLTARRSIIESVGGFRSGFDGAQDHDLVLRLTEQARKVVHVPGVLYHWRQVAGSVALDPSAKQYAYDHGRRAVEDHCTRVGIAARVDAGEHLGTFVVERPTPARVAVLAVAPLHTAGVWGRECFHLSRLAESLARATTQTDVEFIVAVPGGGTALAQRLLDEAGCLARLVEVDDTDADADESTGATRSWSAALDESACDIVVPVTEQMMLDEGSDIGAIAAHLSDSDVPIAGCLHINSDRTVRNGGFVTDHLGAHPILAGWAGSHPGPGRLMTMAREVGAVEVLGGAIRAHDLRALLATDTPSTLTDAGIHFCIRQVAEGNRVIWTSRAAWYRFDTPEQTNAFAAGFDRYSNPNLIAGRGDWLERPGCEGAAPYDLAPDGTRIWS